MKKWLLFALLLVPYLAVDSVRIGNAVDNANDPLAVHRWDNPWENIFNVTGDILGQSDLNITGTIRSPYIKTGNTDFADELKLTGVESLFTGLVSISNSSAYPFLAMSQGTTNTTSNAAAVVLSYGEHDNPGGANVFSVYRLCNLTSSGFCNVGPIAGFGDLSNTLFPNEALDINSDWTGSSQVLRVNGFFLDPSMPVVYIANIATSPAIKVDDGTMVCPNLNADMVDGYSLDQSVLIGSDPSFNTVTASQFIGKSDNATYSDDSNLLDGYDSSEFAMADDIPTRIFENETWIMQDLHVGGQFQFNDSSVEQELEYTGNESQTIYFRLPKESTIENATMNLTGSLSLSSSIDTVIDYTYENNTWVWSDHATTNYCNYAGDPWIHAAKFSYEQYGLIKFDLSDYINLSVSNATMILYTNATTNLVNGDLRVYRITSDWEECNVTWNTKPSVILIGYSYYPTRSNNMTVSLTDSVNDILDGTYENYGWELQHNSSNRSPPDDLFGGAFFNGQNNTANRPLLILNINTVPNNITIDTGNDNNIDYEYSGELNTTVSVDLNVTAINEYLDSCTADSSGFCDVPLVIHSDTAGTLTADHLTVLYDADIYARDVYANQYYAKNTTIVSFDDPIDFTKDSSIAKSISVDNGIFIFPNEFYKKDLIDLDKIWSWSVGAIKEYAWRIGWLEGNVTALKAENEQLKLELLNICKLNNLKGCKT